MTLFSEICCDFVLYFFRLDQILKGHTAKQVSLEDGRTELGFTRVVGDVPRSGQED